MAQSTATLLRRHNHSPPPPTRTTSYTTGPTGRPPCLASCWLEDVPLLNEGKSLPGQKFARITKTPRCLKEDALLFIRSRHLYQAWRRHRYQARRRHLYQARRRIKGRRRLLHIEGKFARAKICPGKTTLPKPARPGRLPTTLRLRSGIKTTLPRPA